MSVITIIVIVLLVDGDGVNGDDHYHHNHPTTINATHPVLLVYDIDDRLVCSSGAKLNSNGSGGDDTGDGRS